MFKGNIKAPIMSAQQIPEGLRHLRNYAKARQRTDILNEINSFNQAKVQDYSCGIVQTRCAYEATVLDARRDIIQQCGRLMVSEGKDEFFAKTIDDMIDIQERQRVMFKSTKDPRIMDSSLADFYQLLISQKEDASVRDINKTLKLQEKYHYMMVIRGMAKAGQWDDIRQFVTQKKPVVSFAFLAEIANDNGKVPLAVEAIRKIADFDEKIPMLIDIGQWRDAIEETF